MAETQREQPIVQELMSEPHIKDRRISVVQIHERVEDLGLAPATVAEQYDLDLADVYLALAYFHQHPREMQAIQTQRAQAFNDLREEIDRPPGVDPTAVDVTSLDEMTDESAHHEQ